MMNTATTKDTNRWTAKYEYSGVITKMIDICGGLNNEVQMSIKKMITLLPPEDQSYGLVSNLRKAGGQTGALKTRTEGGPKNKQHGGRIAYWTWVHDEAWTKEQMMEQYGAPMTCNGIENIMPKVRQQNGHSTAPVDMDVVKDFALPAVETKRTPTDMEVKLRAAGVSPKISDAEALIEAARQYMGREAFIIEELKRFADMGITIDVSAIKVEKDPALEAASHLVPYIDILAGIIDRQADALEKVQQTGANADKVAQLKKDLFDAHEDTRRTRHAYDEYKSSMRTKTNTKDHQIQRLRTEVEDLATKNLQLMGRR